MSTPAYRNSALTIDERVADLPGHITLEEKVGQLMLWDARSEDLAFLNTHQPGSILHILGAKIGRRSHLTRSRSAEGDAARGVSFDSTLRGCLVRRLKAAADLLYAITSGCFG